MVKINFENLAKQILPPHKRTPVRISFLKYMLIPLTYLFDEFVKWRSFQRTLVNVNGRVKVMEGFLRVKYNNHNISVLTSDDILVNIGLLAEGETMLLKIGLKNESTTPDFPLILESQGEAFDVDFIVHIPNVINTAEIIAEIEKYKIIKSTYKIKINS